MLLKRYYLKEIFWQRLSARKLTGILDRLFLIFAKNAIRYCQAVLVAAATATRRSLVDFFCRASDLSAPMELRFICAVQDRPLRWIKLPPFCLSLHFFGLVWQPWLIFGKKQKSAASG